MVDLSVIVPCYNEEGNLRACVTELRAALGAARVSFEIITVDDGSSDGTFGLSQRIAQEHEDVLPLYHDRNRGMGASVRTGLNRASGEFVMVVPGDNQFDPKQIAEMLTAARDVDVIVGRRSSEYATISRQLPSWLYTTGMRVLFDLKLRGEVNIYRRSALGAIENRSDGFFGNTELLIRVLRTGVRARQYPIQFRDRVAGTPTGRDPRQIAKVIVETAKLRARLSLETVLPHRFRR